ncbi:invasion associated locus B family protein [Tritonibacter horizontis]|uniref:Invasion associated locus B (IalB) protein n=1 Tax=Tritonibacter horizontis TaxID=1768241 RepID=A0A132BW81_9RHOB|nr:invasion associated locus B family protein [Tritonibacter horizontis]KUP92631.1 invasion associated locus B (IalB) protein [Tritonibacter horizontis]
MLKSLSSLSLAVLIAAHAPALAQETTEQDAVEQTAETTEDGTPAPKPNADQLLDLGTPNDDASQVGQRYSKEKFGDWDLACVRTNSGEDPCSLVQVLVDDEGGPVAEVSLFRIDTAGGGQAVAGATVIAPLETLLPAGLSISVDGAPGKRYNFSFCNSAGCVAQIGLTEADINAFKQGSAATFSLRPAPAPETVVSVKMSLSGFTSGYNAVDVVSQ